MTYQLVPMEKGQGPAIALTRPVLLIGRHPECDVRIDLAKISRRHCCLALAYDRVVIRDLGSQNGLRLNGRVIDEARLYAGDEVAIGPLLYRLVEQKEATESGPRRPSPASVPASPAKSSRTPNGNPRPDATSPLLDDSGDIGLVPIDDF
jgi:pSer/pThr/pTyr-binding forkhead associated (FHA) protein